MVIIFDRMLLCLRQLSDLVLQYSSGFVCSILSVFTGRIPFKRFSDLEVWFCYPVRLASYLAWLILSASFLLLKLNFSLCWIGISVRMYLILLFSSLSSTGPPVPYPGSIRIPPCLALIQDTEIVGVEPEEPLLDK